MANFINGVPNYVVIGVALGVGYYFFVYESEEDKKKRLAKAQAGGV